MLESMIGGLSFLIVYVYFFMFLPPLVYIFLKWRSYRDGAVQDPQLGMKVVLYFFKTLGYHIFLVSLVIILYNLLGDNYRKTQMGWALLVGGGIIYGVHYFLIPRFTNTKDFPLTQRLFNSFNMILVGLAATTAMLITLSIIFEDRLKNAELPFLAMIVYMAAWVCQGIMFLRKPAKPTPPPVQTQAEEPIKSE